MKDGLGNLSPGTKIRSTPSSMMIAILIVPPDEPSLDMASANAISRRDDRQSFLRQQNTSERGRR